ncbi:right-handed parallel beta-helix repeat-containing protein [Bradyrhizobium sp. CCGB12]|uniref:right-handed parallel beta-helix repeat-containing protein n=1 Tax=Bradyrhizobium sp. CCGB12 TaxID=2949632 RepID=UPI0020B3C96F|nr:right-handed parallel beta-helix repeat-containing protein [Bradyrhizobium sp. CCGB12]MCP3390676.1 right-handed parallel beta-helix repeat-containing protein [Bradyrhizobium sp. CCGB12]
MSRSYALSITLRVAVFPAVFQLLLSSYSEAETITLRGRTIDLSGFPNATNTGVPPGTTLKESDGFVVSSSGAVIEGLDIKGGVVIDAPNVTLRNCKITYDGFYVVLIKGGVKGTVIQNCELDNLGSGGQCIAGQGSFLRNNIRNCADGIAVGGNDTLIEGNYIHDMRGTAASHFDGIQADGNFSHLTIRHNTIINDNIQTSAIMVDNYAGPIDDVLIENNLLIGGGYTVYLNEIGKGQLGGGPVTNVTFINNQLAGWHWGGLDLRTELGNMPTISGNINKTTGATIPAWNRPVSKAIR